MNTLLSQIRETLFSAPDSVCLQRACLVTEAYQLFAQDPISIKRAKTLRHVLANMDLDLYSNPIFAGNTSSRPRAWMLLPEYSFNMDAQVLIENRGLEGLLDGQIPDDILNYWTGRQFGGNYGLGHLAVDLNSVVHEGLLGLISKTQQSWTGEDENQREYRLAMQISLQAVIDWAGRYAQAARFAAENENDPTIRACLERVASACQQVPAQPARNLFEALQAIVLIHFAIAIEGHGVSVSIGLPDRVLAPFVDHTFDPEESTDLITAFLLKIAANSVSGRGSKTQAITIGGVDHLGQDCCNEVTGCFLEACDRARVGDPHLFLRWHRAMSSEIRQRAATLLAQGLSMPLLVNDVPTAQGFIKAGVSSEDAWRYCVIGCNELGIPGCSAESATATSGTIQYLGLLNQVLVTHPDPDSIQNMAQLMAEFEQVMLRTAIKMRQEGRNRRQQMAEEVPTPFTSALMRGCIDRGEDFVTGMVYALPGIYERGLTNAVNALSVIEHVVFTDQKISLSGLVGQMTANYPDEALRQRLLNAPKWGNDDPKADRWAQALVEMRERVLDAVDANFQQPPHMVCHVVRSLHHLAGLTLGASPDGRHSGDPISDSIGSPGGTSNKGPTAILNSVLNLDAAQYRGGYNLNLTLTHSDGLSQTLGALIETFFARGGQELQVNVLDARTLRAAMDDPSCHGDLVVRVAGFSARFIDLSPLEQRELIIRAESI